ncbi:secretory phospholipase A2 receptor-like isoform X1 [Micropterus salmoides]|uniref:secretory phospholipase A2 receptor-like isoform X1 n=1 Tax=Micropterus salmoides TaxID=27706 RepID=UPI0018ECE588|nr:secretory phospholipase A2 receptor-like isoform X1 [Micropterus salmoides]
MCNVNRLWIQHVTNQALVLFTGWDPSSCLLHQYHSVPDRMSWTEAQTYCRQKYTDLATIENTEEVNKVINTVPSSGNHMAVWIGVYVNLNWRWSDGYTGTGADYVTSIYVNPVLNSEPNTSCVLGGSTWQTSNCKLGYPFICNNGTQLDPEFVYVSQTLSWLSAQRYCRENFMDLATVRNDTESQKVQSLIPSEKKAWIGLFGDPHTYWSDGSNSSFRFWYTGSQEIDWKSVACGLSDVDNRGKWLLLPCNNRYAFVCYSVPVMKRAVKLRMKLEDSSVDLNDPAVKADLLKKLQDKLQQKGEGGVTLKWREQPDGKVFHKEEDEL